MQPVIECRSVVKTFGSTRALDGLDLTVVPGEVHGFLGPNGSGKTVTMRIVLGLLRPDAGSVAVLGADPWHDAVELHRTMAYVPGDTNLWPNLTGGEILDLLAGLRGGVDQARRDDLVERFQLDVRKKARNYSKGNRQKVALVAALACDAELFIFDEPTAGLDPLMDVVFQQEVAQLRRQGRSVLLSSHVLGEVEKLCDRVTIIRDGATVQSGTLDELRHLTRTTVAAELSSPPSSLESMTWAHALRNDSNQITFEVDSDRLDDALRYLADHGVRALTSHPPTLEELFLRQYGPQVTEPQATDAQATDASAPGGDGNR
jgi:ABC-2 type transport system ATP-binding protein